MKITKKQLRRIIEEEIQAHPRSASLDQPRTDETDFPAVVGYTINGQRHSEIVYDTEELVQVLDYLAPLSPRGKQIPYSIDALSDVEAADVPVGARIEQYAEGKDQNKDGKNDFEDVKIARMRASGMSDAEIRKKHPDLFEGEKSSHPRQYGAPEGSKRDKQLDASIADLKSGDPEREKRAWARRERMEKKERSKSGYKNKPRSDSKKESHMRESEIRRIIRSVLEEELSKKTKATLRKKAEKRGLTPGSVEAEYKKGLAAWGSSGSRKGMSQHQWAMARVNSATPSKDWAVVKKSKKK